MGTTYFLCCITKQLIKLNPSMTQDMVSKEATKIWNSMKIKEQMYYYIIENKLRTDCLNVIIKSKITDISAADFRDVLYPLSKHKVYCKKIHYEAIKDASNLMTSKVLFSDPEYLKLSTEFLTYNIVKQCRKSFL